jgi:hypothetical protein
MFDTPVQAFKGKGLEVFRDRVIEVPNLSVGSEACLLPLIYRQYFWGT